MPFARRREPHGRAGDAKVGDARGAVDADQDVVRGDVAVDDLERGAVTVGELVGGVQAGEQVEEDAQREPERQGAPLLARADEDLVEREAIDVLHHQEDALIVLLHIERGHHVGVVHPRGEAGLIEEHGDEIRLLGQVRVHRFDRDLTLESAGSDGAAEVDPRHPAGGDRTEDLVATNPEAHAAEGYTKDSPAVPATWRGRAFAPARRRRGSGLLARSWPHFAPSLPIALRPLTPFEWRAHPTT